MRAKRSLGQNFLIGTHYPRRIVSSVSPQPGETIIEIGPGKGALTGLLLESGAILIAIELDRELIQVLQQRYDSYPNFRLIEADALEIDLGKLLEPATRARLVGNLPYNIATPILQRLIDQRQHISEMTLMLQREVVRRIVAVPGGKEYGYLSVLSQFYCEAEKLFDVPPGAFQPVPKVWSSVLRLRVRERAAAPVKDEILFLELIKVLFSQRRKTILNNLRAGKARIGLTASVKIADIVERSAIDPQRRAETLALDEIARLADALALSL
jgi:16S rRNA (adenine1518-N6/adenine1519-N6)-dimethyltransferase